MSVLPSDAPTQRSNPAYVCNSGVNLQLDLRSGIALTPHLQHTAKLQCSLTHAGQAPMPFPVTVLEDRRIEPNAVVTHTHCECPLGKDDFHFDQPGTCMLKGIPDSLPGDAIHLIAHDRYQCDLSTLYQNAKIRRGAPVVAR